MLITSLVLRSAAAALSATALLVCTPNAGAEEPNCEQDQQQPPQDQQQCDQGAGIAGEIVDGVQDGLDQATQQGQQGNSEGLDLADMNCMVVDGVPMMVANGQVFRNVHTMQPCWAVHGLTPHP